MGINTDGFGASAFGFAMNDQSTWTFAWAAHAGVAYTITPNLKLELAYRYLNRATPRPRKCSAVQLVAA
jgi:opacity protein-like surface antigen